MLVISISLGESLLNNWSPNTTIVANVSVNGCELAVLSLNQRQEIIDNDRLGETQGVDIDSINACSAKFIGIVKEKLFDSAGEFSKSCNSGDEPAVANESLLHIFNSDAILTEER